MQHSNKETDANGLKLLPHGSHVRPEGCEEPERTLLCVAAAERREPLRTVLLGIPTCFYCLYAIKAN